MQTIKKIFLALTIITIIGVYFKTSQKNFTPNKNRFIIGTVGGYAPFVSINPQGKYEGFDIDVAQALAQKMDLKLEIKDLGSMSSLFIALEQGKIDAIIWALSITQERLNKVAMIRYQGDDTTSYPILFWQSIPNNATTIEQLGNITICTETGSSQEAALNKYDCFTKIAISHVDDGLLNIQYKTADGVIVEPAIAKKFQQKYPAIKIMQLPLAPENQVQGIGIAIKKNNIDLTESIRQAVKELENNGTIAELEQKWNIAS